MKNSIGSRTDVGRVRDGNEDSLLIEAPLFAVADGMGGHLGGEVASATAVEIIERRTKEEDGRVTDALGGIVKQANRAIYEKARTDSRLSGMGTTCTLVYVDGNQAFFAHVGDSRAYRLRDGALEQLTEDHTLVERMVREGRLNRDEAAQHPQRSIITRALGVDQNVEVDEFTVQLEAGDRLLLCSDGLSSMLADDTIKDLLASGDDAQSTADKLVDAANEAGGEDNITVIVLDIGTGDEPVAEREEIPRSAIGNVPPPAPGPHASDRAEPEPPPSQDSGSRWGRRLVIGLAVVLLVVVGAFAAIRYSLGNSWFVGADDDGTIAIFKGIPEEVVGMNLREVEEESPLRLADLPDHLQDNVEEGIKVDSREEAEQTLSDLEDRAAEASNTRGDGN